jgi:hypothetical protein
VQLDHIAVGKRMGSADVLSVESPRSNFRHWLA